ncbi:MAG: DUF4339 domain-containing protein [Verrucomicrobiales bacterium]|jgi:hypothetical protein|nr:DUF4339 domain-containing protein [Verrucomicrobiales bacterium]
MYKIIGGDQKEYGPVSFDQLTQWIRDNRANAQTLIQKEGGPWMPLGSIPEFSAALAAQQSASPAALPGEAAPPAPESQAFPPLGSATPAGFGLGSDSVEKARQSVQGPATGLMVTGILCAILAVIGLIGNLFGGGFQPPPGGVPPEMQPIFDILEKMQGPVAIISTLFGLAVSGLAVFASQKLRALEGFVLTVVTVALLMIPCTSPCCCIGIPVGIWVLVVMFKPEVKSAFR